MQGIDLFPSRWDMKGYNFSFFKRDLTSAFSVALLALPQAMAYAFLAGLPASAGIWSVIFGTILVAAFGHSRYLVAGSTNLVAILILSGTSEILSTYYGESLESEREALALNIVLQLTFTTGVFQFFAAFLRFGRLTQFTSRSVIVGYVLGSAVAIVVTQLFTYFGIEQSQDYRPIYQQGWYFLSHIHRIHIVTTMLATGSLIILIFLFKLSPKIPAAALVFFLSGILVASLKFPHIALLGDIGFIPSDLPSLTLPVFDVRIIGKLIPLAFAIMLLSILETTTIGRSYTSGKEPPYNDNQEIYGLGIGNLITAFLGCMPSSGSFSRSALNFSLRPKTRFSSVFSGVFVLLFVVLFGLWIKKIPLAALSALMILTAYTMVNFRDLKICLKGTRGDAFVVIVTFLSTLFFTLDVALYVGIALSIALYLRHASTPRITEYSFNNFGKLRPLEEGDRRPDPRICIFQAEGELFFGAAELFQSKMHQIIEDENIKVVILQLLNIRYLDASVCLALEKIYTYLEGTHRYLLLAGITPEVRHILKNTGVMETLGSQNCFAAKGQLPSEPTREAYAYAKTLINIPLI